MCVADVVKMMWVLSHGGEELPSCCLSVMMVPVVSFNLRCRGVSVHMCTSRYMLMLLDVCGCQRSTSGITPQSLSALFFEAGSLIGMEHVV